MKKIILTLLVALAGVSAYSQIRVSEMTTFSGNADSFYLPAITGLTSPLNRKVLAKDLSRDKVDSVWLQGGNLLYRRFGTTYNAGSFAAGSVTSVGLTMPAAFSVSGTPVTGAGTLAVSATGSTLQYIRGDGSLSAFTVGGYVSAGSGITVTGAGTLASPLQIASSAGAANLSLVRAAGNNAINNSNGSGVTLLPVDASLAGLMVPGDYNRLWQNTYFQNLGALDTIMRKVNDSTVGFKSIRVAAGSGISVTPTITADQILYTVANTGGGGSPDVERITSGTVAAGSSSVVIDLGANYYLYTTIEIIISGATFNTANEKLYLRTSNNGTTYSSGATDYRYKGGPGASYVDADHIELCGGFPASGTDGGASVNGHVWIYNAGSTSLRTQFEYNMATQSWFDGDFNINTGRAQRSASESDQYIKLLTSAGTMAIDHYTVIGYKY
jgi:hypothetical protein